MCQPSPPQQQQQTFTSTSSCRGHSSRQLNPTITTADGATAWLSPPVIVTSKQDLRDLVLKHQHVFIEQYKTHTKSKGRCSLRHFLRFISLELVNTVQGTRAPAYKIQRVGDSGDRGTSSASFKTRSRTAGASSPSSSPTTTSMEVNDDKEDDEDQEEQAHGPTSHQTESASAATTTTSTSLSFTWPYENDFVAWTRFTPTAFALLKSRMLTYLARWTTACCEFPLAQMAPWAYVMQQTGIFLAS